MLLMRTRMRKSAPSLLTLWGYWQKWPQYRNISLLGRRRRSPHLHRWCCRCLLDSRRRRCRFHCNSHPLCRPSTLMSCIHSCGSINSSSCRRRRGNSSIGNLHRRSGSSTACRRSTRETWSGSGATLCRQKWTTAFRYGQLSKAVRSRGWLLLKAALRVRGG